MADASSDWADRPASDQALSSDEEDFVSSQSTASAEPDALTQKHLTPALCKLHLDTPQHQHPAQSSDQSAPRTSTPGTGASILATSKSKPERKKMELLDLPLDVLKLIVKEVSNEFSSTPSLSSVYHYTTRTEELTYVFMIGDTHE